MLDIGWSEMALIALIALIVIGPKDLPRVMRTAGQWTRKARTAARDFQANLEDMIEDEEIREAKDSIERQARESVSDLPTRPGKRGAFDIGKSLEKQIDPDGSMRNSMREIEQQTRRTEPARASDSGGESAAAIGARSASGAPGGDAVTRETAVSPGQSVHAASPTTDGEAGGPAGPSDDPARARTTTSSDSSA